MAKTPRTLRLSFPQWQGGDITGYRLGAMVLDQLIPAPGHMVSEAVAVPVPPAGRSGLLESPETNHTSSYDQVHAQLQQAVSLIDRAAPERILTIGGDCAVSIAPFAWLASKYPEFGVVWVDAHPDMWAADEQPHANARAASILSGQDATDLDTLLPTTVPADKFVWVGTRAEVVPQLVDLDRVWSNRVRVDEVEASPRTVVERLRRKGVRQIAVHFDLDVLDANEFHGVAVGEERGMTWRSVAGLLQSLDSEFELVGLTIAEHIPEGLETLREIISATSLMRSDFDAR
ncbi:arginase family protein [Microbacterium paraoxydans]|uniref:arginase family protein n=1 Tax=Microbacterium paraoxydans TaxID=199592 RepID=UPI001CFB13F5|nr:arginase family protein [Microbacterium paraoxydans]